MSKKTFEDMLGNRGDSARKEDDDELVLLPGPDTPYQAASHQSNKGLVRLWVVKNEFRQGGKPYRAFQYVHLDSPAEVAIEGKGYCMTFRFNGSIPVQIEAYGSGKGFLQVADYISLHRIGWIREGDRKDGELVFTRIEITELLEGPSG